MSQTERASTSDLYRFLEGLDDPVSPGCGPKWYPKQYDPYTTNQPVSAARRRRSERTVNIQELQNLINSQTEEKNE